MIVGRKFEWLALSATDPERVSAAMREAMGLLARGEIRLEVTDVLSLADAAKAHRRMEQRATIGKLVLRVGTEGP